MARVTSFDDPEVGRGDGDYFKVSGTKDHPQIVAYIPGEVFLQDLEASADLRNKAKGGDKEAQEQLEATIALKEVINKSLNKKPPSAEVWSNEQGKKCILYAKSIATLVNYIPEVGYVLHKEGIPEGVFERPPMVWQTGVLLEYDLDQEGNIKILPADQQIDIDGESKLTFKYTLRPWPLKPGMVKAWKEHARGNPMIKCDYSTWVETQGKSERVKFSPQGPALWRETPGVMSRIIREARKIYGNIPRSGAKDLSVEDILKCFPEKTGKFSSPRSTESHSSEKVSETDFAKLLGEAVEPPKESKPPEETPVSPPIATAVM